MNRSRNQRLATQASILLVRTIADLNTTIHAKALIRAGLISKTKLNQLLVQLEQLDFSQKPRPAPEHYPEQAEKLSSTLRHAAFLTTPTTPKGE